jgi:hypothetical protein
VPTEDSSSDDPTAQVPHPRYVRRDGAVPGMPRQDPVAPGNSGGTGNWRQRWHGNWRQRWHGNWRQRWHGNWRQRCFRRWAWPEPQPTSPSAIEPLPETTFVFYRFDRGTNRANSISGSHDVVSGQQRLISRIDDTIISLTARAETGWRFPRTGAGFCFRWASGLRPRTETWSVVHVDVWKVSADGKQFSRVSAPWPTAPCLSGHRLSRSGVL